MLITTKFISKASLLGALALATVVIGQAVQAHPTPVEATAALQAVSITKQRAEAIALQAVGGGTALQAVLEREDHFIHWSVDIVGSTDEYEVWVSTRGKVLKIITQPL
ncbi:MAG: PepSY domain-containing protein [Steroidobacteraceae bacterium]